MQNKSNIKSYRLPDANHSSVGFLIYFVILITYQFYNSPLIALILCVSNYLVMMISDGMRYQNYQAQYIEYLNTLDPYLVAEHLDDLRKTKKDPATERFLTSYLTEPVFFTS